MLSTDARLPETADGFFFLGIMRRPVVTNMSGAYDLEPLMEGLS